MKQLTITKPDDWHLHLRDGVALQTTVGFTARQFGRAIVMPNLTPPVTSVHAATQYHDRVLKAAPADSNFQPLMTLYLTDNTSVSDIIDASKSNVVYAAKLYPAGATTNSDSGVTNISKMAKVFDAMQKYALPLLVHAEVTDANIDIFDREQVFIDRHLNTIRADFPDLKIVLEHATTEQAIDYVLSNKHVAATLTPQHLLLNRNDLLAGGVRPHNYCLPILKRENHRQALLKAATSGDPKFFLGTDSAPHAINAKENNCGCAGCFSAHAAIELYTEAFDNANALDKLEGFSSFYGAAFYGLPRNKEKITLIQESWQAPASYPYAGETIQPFRQETPLKWRIKAG